MQQLGEATQSTLRVWVAWQVGRRVGQRPGAPDYSPSQKGVCFASSFTTRICQAQGWGLEIDPIKDGRK